MKMAVVPSDTKLENLKGENRKTQLICIYYVDDR